MIFALPYNIPSQNVTALGERRNTVSGNSAILFSAPMVRALLAGAKTQTRRIVKPQECVEHHGGAVVHVHDKTCPGFCDFACSHSCRYGVPGDRLWVRERMRRIGAVLDCFDRPSALDIKYEADGQIAIAVPFPKRLKGVPKHGQCLAYGGYREASRITLEITGVRVERLQNVSEKDAEGEGILSVPLPHGISAADPVSRFRWLWESINGPTSWDKNPWVWVVEFKRVQP